MHLESASAPSLASSAFTFSGIRGSARKPGVGGEVGVTRIGDAAPLGPILTEPMSILMNAHTMSRPLPNATASLMCGKNLSLFSM